VLPGALSWQPAFLLSTVSSPGGSGGSHRPLQGPRLRRVTGRLSGHRSGRHVVFVVPRAVVIAS
jgi:hypothetical protein